MERKDLINKILNQIHFSLKSIGINEILKLVTEYKRLKGLKWVELIPTVQDGFLFLNGDEVGRIAPKMPKIAYTDYSYNLEGKCIRD